jgi:hypothetical protein
MKKKTGKLNKKARHMAGLNGKVYYFLIFRD